jgi:hypothetical protein
METKKILNNTRETFKYAFIFLAILAGLLVLFAALKALFMYGLYSFFLSEISAKFGLDMPLARLLAVFGVVAAILALPSIIFFLFFGKREKTVIIIILVVAAAWFLGLNYGTSDVFFDRTTGKPAKYYIKTLEGFRFSFADDFDPKLGIRFKPITPEIMKEYQFWQETGKLKNIPEIKEGEYFNRMNGEAIVWYSERSNGEIKLFPLPGYDPMTGELLKPMTPEMTAKITEKQAKLEQDKAHEQSMLIMETLKKENTDLKNKVEKVNTELEKRQYQGAVIETLRKENADLKNKLEKVRAEPEKRPKAPPVIAEPKAAQKPQRTVEVKDLVISAYEFKRIRQKVICHVRIENDSPHEAIIQAMADDGREYERASLLYDDLGNQYVASEVMFGNIRSEDIVRNEIPPGTHLNLIATFRDVSSQAHKATIRLGFWLEFRLGNNMKSWEGLQHPVLRDIPISD